jgi:4-hydroxyacetophenone monooxygenase
MSAPALAPLPADDSDIEAALEHAEFVALLGALAHITGDLDVLRPELRPDALKLREPNSGYSPDQLALAREVCLEALRTFRDELGGVPARPDDVAIRTIMEFTAGTELSDRYIPLLAEELAIDGDEVRAPRWTRDQIDPDRPFTVAIIGAGMSGIAAAHRLDQAGVEFVVFDKNHDVGGTWLENSYPGCRVDIQNHMYSYSFAQRTDWPRYFSPRDVLADYFRSCAERFGLMDRIELDTEVRSAEWDDDAQLWRLEVSGPDGVRRVSAHAVVSAVGQLNRPGFPDIAGVAPDGSCAFAGPSFHTARWDHSVDLAGKRVAVVGTGASACQVIPAIAGEVAELTVFQRTPPWCLPALNYSVEVAPGLQWLFGHVPFYAQWYRCWLFWRGAESMMPYAVVDPEYPPTELSVSAANDDIRLLLVEWLRLLTDGDPELFEQVLPDYPPFSKRFVVDDGAYISTLRQPHVSLETTPIERIEPGGVRTSDGALHEVDVIVFGTGFQAADFLTPMRVVGRGGIDLHERWQGDARAYLGIVVPGFPNFFCLYGPNTNIVVNGSIIYYSECEVHYVVECIRLLLDEGAASLDCREAVHDAYNDRIDAANALRTWGFSKVRSWYKNSTGRTAQNWPFSVLEFWEQTRTPDPDDFDIRALDRVPVGG